MPTVRLFRRALAGTVPDANRIAKAPVDGVRNAHGGFRGGDNLGAHTFASLSSATGPMRLPSSSRMAAPKIDQPRRLCAGGASSRRATSLPGPAQWLRPRGLTREVRAHLGVSSRSRQPVLLEGFILKDFRVAVLGLMARTIGALPATNFNLSREAPDFVLTLERGAVT